MVPPGYLPCGYGGLTARKRLAAIRRAELDRVTHAAAQGRVVTQTLALVEAFDRA